MAYQFEDQKPAPSRLSRWTRNMASALTWLLVVFFALVIIESGYRLWDIYDQRQRANAFIARVEARDVQKTRDFNRSLARWNKVIRKLEWATSDEPTKGN